MKKLVLKPFVLPTMYVLAVVLILIGSYFSSLSLINSNEEMAYLEYVNDTIINNDVPVIKTDIAIKRPYVDESVSISKQFYDKSASEDKQVNAILSFNDYYVPNEGIVYSAPNKFDIYAILSGTVSSIRKDDDLGTIVEIKHGNNLVSVYQSIGEPNVLINDIITQGQKIGVSGTNNMNNKGENQLHFELYYLNEAVNPELYYDKKISEL